MRGACRLQKHNTAGPFGDVTQTQNLVAGRSEMAGTAVTA